MRNLKKVLSALLAMVMLFSAMSIGVEAAYSAYKDGAITAWDSLDKPILSTQQYASMALDEVDRMLAVEDLSVKYDLAGLLTIDLDLSSVDAALNSVTALWSTVSNMAGTIGGDVVNLNFSAITSSTSPRRSTEGKTDLDVLLSLFQFLADNAALVAKIPQGTVADGGLDLGIIAGFVDVTEYLNLELLAKKAVANLVYPDYEDDPEFASFDPTSLTLDQYISTFIDLIVDGTYDPEKSKTINKISGYIQQYVPGINDQIDVIGDSVYDIIERAVRIALNSVAVPLLNSDTKGRKMIREFCGVKYTEILDAEGKGTDTYTQDDSKLNEYAQFINLDYTVTPFDTSSWGAVGTDSFVNHLNEIIGHLLTDLVNPEAITINWNYDDGNAGLLDNIIEVGKVLLGSTGDSFFASYVEVLDTTNMTDMELIAYLTRTILNSSIDQIFIENNANTQTLLGVLYELVKQLAMDVVPSQNYNSLPISVDSILFMLSDMGVYGLKQVTNISLSYGMGIDAFANACVTWVQQNYGGFVGSIEGETGWEKLSYVFFKIIPANWLPLDADGWEREDLYTVLKDDVVQNILDLNFEGLFGLLDRNPDGELNLTIIELLLSRVVEIINYVIPGAFSSTYSYDSLEVLLGSDLLSDLLYNLLTGLNNRIGDIAVSLLPLLCSILDLSAPEEFGYPYIGLPETLDITSTSSFYMYNGSGGINTGARSAQGGNATRDNLYTYEILNVETNQPGVTVTPTSGTINGGQSKTFSFVGTPAYDSVLSVTITYNVKQEQGGNLTSTPLTATSYTYVAGLVDGEIQKDDGDENVKADANATGNLHLIYYKAAKYINQGGKVSDIKSVDFTLQRNVAKQATQHTNEATISLSSASVASGLAAMNVTSNPMNPITTTKKGGAWIYVPYNVSAVDTPREDIESGTIYQSNFSFTATPTMSASENFSIQQFVCFYDDWGLPGIYENAIEANRQQSNYNMGSYTAKYVEFEESRTTLAEGETHPTYEESVTGSEVWAEYVEALEAATAIICRPRYINDFATTHGEQYYTVAFNLYTAIQKLENGGAVSSGAANIETTLRSFVPETAIVPGSVTTENPNGISVEYYQDGYVFFGREDYVGYTYGNFKEKKNEAEDLIFKWEKGESINSVKAAYVNYRLGLYGNRLIRTRAYNEHLVAELAKANAIQAGHYSAKSWTNFINARTFAASVAQEAIGTCYSGSENLSTAGVRQTKVNTALDELVSARKKLVSGVDYAQLEAAVTAAKATYDAGNTPEVYTVATWTPFVTAYEAAVALIGAELKWSETNQATVNTAVTTLSDAFSSLASAAQPGVEIAEGSTGFFTGSNATSPDDGRPVKVMTGLAADASVTPRASDKLSTVGGATYELDYSFNPSRTESTGTRVMVYNASHELVDSYWLVYFGDIDGNASIDGNDIGKFGTDVIDYGGEWGYGNNNPWFYAADLDHNGAVDGGDGGYFAEVIDWSWTPNQLWQSSADDFRTY